MTAELRMIEKMDWDFWAFPFGSGFPFQSFFSTLKAMLKKGFPLQSLTQLSRSL